MDTNEEEEKIASKNHKYDIFKSKDEKIHHESETICIV